MIKLILLYIIVAGLAGAAICLILDISFDTVWRKVARLSDNRTLSQRLSIVSGVIPKGFFKRQNYNTALVLKAMGKEGNYTIIQMISGFAAIFGALVAISINNYFLVPLLAIICWFIPRVALSMYVQAFKKRLNYELETALRILTSSYKNTHNLVVTIRENITMINPPVRAFFEMFLTEMDSIDPSITSALNRMKARIPNRIFYEWVNAMIQCQSDASLVSRLDDVLENYENEHIANARLKTEVGPAQSMVYIMAIFSIVLVFFVASMSPEWKEIILNHPAGKFTVALLAFIDIVCVYLTYKLGDPIEYTHDDD